MRSSALVFSSLVVFATTACANVTGSGIKRTEARKVAAFTEVEVSGGVRLEVKQGATSLTIEGDDNIVPLYSTEVVGDRLHVRRTTTESVRTKQPLVVRVSTPVLERLVASGGVEATVDGATSKRFATELSGGVVLKVNALDVEALDLEASGGVDITMAGRAKVARLNTSGGVGFKGARLELATVDLDASGGCTLEVMARESIAGEVSGGAGLKVFGSPAKSRVRTSGGADVEYVN